MMDMRVAQLVVTPTLFFVIESDALQLLTGYGELMLAEFKYGLVPKESFSRYVDQSKSNR